MRAFFAVVLFVALTCTLWSCREGCKNKTALNYDSRAQVDNGTCLYCSSSVINDTGVYFFTTDSAPVQPSVEFILIVTDSSVNGNGCRTVGKISGNVCNNYLRIVNLTNVNASGFIDLTFDQNNITAFEWSGNVQLSPRDTLTLTGIFADTCANLTTGTLDGNLNLVFN